MTVLQVQPDRLDLPAAQRHARWPRDNLALLAQLDPRDPWDLPVPKARKDWQDIRVPKGLKAFQDRGASRARPVLWALRDRLGLLAPSAR